MGEGNSTQSAGPGVNASYATATPTRFASIAQSSLGPSTSTYIANKGHGTIGPDGVREGHQLALGLGLGLGGLLLLCIITSFWLLNVRRLERRAFVRRTSGITKMFNLNPPAKADATV